MGDAQKETDEIKKQQLLASANKEFTTAFEIDSLDVQSCFNLAVVEYRRKNYERSVFWSRKVLEIKPGYSDVYVNLGDAYVLTNGLDSAERYYNLAIQVTGKTAESMIKLGNVCFAAKDTANAVKRFEEATQLDSTSIDAWTKLANVAGMDGQYEKSNRAFLKLAAMNPNSPEPYKMLYTNYKMMGDSMSMNAAAQEYYKRGGK